MPTANQLVRKPRTRPANRTKTKALQGNPQKRGTVTRTFVMTPKKPNSAKRHCCRVRLTNGFEVTAYVPGKGMRIQEHSNVLIKGGRVKDLPGVRYKVVRGSLDCGPVDFEDQGGKANSVRRARGRSLYGVPKTEHIKVKK